MKKVTFVFPSLSRSVVIFLRAKWHKHLLTIGLRFLKRSPKSQKLTNPSTEKAFSRLLPNETAQKILSRQQKFRILILGELVLLGLLLNWHATLFTLVSFLTILYFVDLVFTSFIIYRSFVRSPEIRITNESFQKRDNWPTYTIFCPLYKEGQVVHQFIQAIQNLDYPKDKLQVFLLLEQDDKETQRELKGIQLPIYFKTVLVPKTHPQTKPKAINFGLRYATGEYCVIFDAEDIPDVYQLKKAVIAFGQVASNVVCIQSKLNFYNTPQNLLTRLFTAEYAVWFELILTGLQSLNAPIPLGGTSNYFLTQKLKSLGGWDAYNVTEDADLGIRLSKRGCQTAILDSTTLEEANSNLTNWLKQRSRWIKGYIQTYLVHSRSVPKAQAVWNRRDSTIFQLVVGGKALSILVNPLMWGLTVCYFTLNAQVGNFIQSLFWPQTFYLATFSLIIGNFLYAYFYMVGITKRRQWNLAIFVFLTPIYWLGMSLAAGIAIYDLFIAPHRWYKTEHGLHIRSETKNTWVTRIRRKLAIASA